MIYIPENGRVVFGVESWWGEIKSVDDLKDITDADINSVWYVNALKAMTENEKPEEPAPEAKGE